MNRILAHPAISGIAFLALTAGVYLAALLLTGRLDRIDQPGLVSMGLTIDLVVLVPLAFHLLVVRPGGHSPLRVVPVVVISLVAASLILPEDHERTLRVLETVLFPAEIGLLGWIVWRVSRALGTARRQEDLDPLEQFRDAAFGLLRNRRLAGIFASEIGVFFYAMGTWRLGPHRPEGSAAFTHHRRSGMAGIVLGFVFLLVFEGIAVHLLIAHWSHLAAWILTAGTLYGVLWLVADLRATVLRPILVDPERVLLRAGLRFTLEIPRDAVDRIADRKPEGAGEEQGLKLFGPPSHWIVLREPAFAEGPYGIRKRVLLIGIEPDDAAGLIRALESPAS